MGEYWRAPNQQEPGRIRLTRVNKTITSTAQVWTLLVRTLLRVLSARNAASWGRHSWPCTSDWSGGGEALIPSESEGGRSAQSMGSKLWEGSDKDSPENGAFRELLDRPDNDHYLGMGLLGSTKPVLPYLLASWLLAFIATRLVKLLFFKLQGERNGNKAS